MYQRYEKQAKKSKIFTMKNVQKVWKKTYLQMQKNAHILSDSEIVFKA